MITMSMLAKDGFVAEMPSPISSAPLWSTPIMILEPPTRVFARALYADLIVLKCLVKPAFPLGLNLAVKTLGSQ